MDSGSYIYRRFHGSIASGNSAYSNHDPIYHQSDDSTLHSSFNGSEPIPVLDNESQISNTSSSRYSKLTNNTKQFTTPTLPVNIESLEEEGVLNGDNRSITENTTDHSAHHRDIPTGS